MALSTNDKLSMALDDIPSKNAYSRNSTNGFRTNRRRPLLKNRKFQPKQLIKHIIRISNLNHTIRDRDLMELFSSIGPVTKTWVDYDRTDRSLGTGGCIYERERDAKQALSHFNGTKIEGLPVNLEYQGLKTKSLHTNRFKNQFANKGRRNNRPLKTRGRFAYKLDKCPW